MHEIQNSQIELNDQRAEVRVQAKPPYKNYPVSLPEDGQDHESPESYSFDLRVIISIEGTEILFKKDNGLYKMFIVDEQGHHIDYSTANSEQQQFFNDFNNEYMVSINGPANTFTLTHRSNLLPENSNPKRRNRRNTRPETERLVNSSSTQSKIRDSFRGNNGRR